MESVMRRETLSDEEIDRFVEDGFVHLEQVRGDADDRRNPGYWCPRGCPDRHDQQLLRPTSSPHGDWGECTAVGPGKKPAASAWATEPVQSLTGVSVAPLKRAVLDLRHGRTTDTGDLSCYPAAIVDLQNLESTTRQEMARNVLVGYEIGHLNQFFENRQYVLGGPDNPVVPK